LPGFPVLPAASTDRELSFARVGTAGVSRRIGAATLGAAGRNPLDGIVVCIRADDGRGGFRQSKPDWRR